MIIKITKRATLRLRGDRKSTFICLCTERDSASGKCHDVFRCILKFLDDRVPYSKNRRVKGEVLGRTNGLLFRVRVTLRLTVYRQSVRLGDKPFETYDTVILFSNWTLAVIVLMLTSSLTRGWVCRLQLLVVLGSAVILRSESRGTHDHILLSQIRDSPNLEGQVPVFISPVTGWPRYTPRHCVPFWPPPTTRRPTVEVFDPTSTRDGLLSFHNNLRVCFGEGRKENTASNSSVVAYVTVAPGTYLLSRYLIAPVSSGSTIPAFRRHVTLLPP
jgi:hypothetical protein